MQNLIAIWTGLTAQRRIVVVLATIAMFAAVLAVARMASTPTMALLYAGIDGPASADVIQALDQQGVVYEVRGSAVYVEASRRDQLRLTLAGEGLPANGAQGYEILDSLSGFGTTAQMFDAAYWRAKEGELARTIMASPLVSSARVHLSASQSQPFRRDQALSGSVTVTPNAGALGAGQANALRHLVASAVAGLDAANVSVIDATNGTILGAETPARSTGEVSDRAMLLKQNAERLLEARVGPGRAVVEVSLDVTTESEQITERLFDPDSRVAISTDTEERTTTSSGSDGGGVTVASNLPQGDAEGATRSSNANSSQTQERINYEVSETQREIVRAPGTIKRMSVAVLVDGERLTTETGVVEWSPRSPEEIEALRVLVASAVGFDESRGDILTIQSLEFMPPVEEGTLAEPGWMDSIALDVMSLIQLLALCVLALVLGLFVVRPLLLAPERSAPAPALTPPSPIPEPEHAISGEIQDELSGLPDLGPIDFPDSGNLPALPGISDNPGDRLKSLVEDHQEESREILRRWMTQDGEAA